MLKLTSINAAVCGLDSSVYAVCRLKRSWFHRHVCLTAPCYLWRRLGRATIWRLFDGVASSLPTFKRHLKTARSLTETTTGAREQRCGHVDALLYFCVHPSSCTLSSFGLLLCVKFQKYFVVMPPQSHLCC